MILRPYQDRMVDQTRTCLEPYRSVVIQSECGSGKGTITAYMIHRAVARGRYVLFLVHGRDRVMDCHQRVTKLGVEHGVLMGGSKRERWHKAQVASSDTVYRMQHKPKADLIVIDECHLAMSPTFRSVLDCYPDAKIIGMSATPMLGNGRALGVKSGGIFEAMVKGPGVNELISHGHLVGSRVMAPTPPPDLAGLKKKNTGEFDDNQGAAICDNSKVIGDVVDHWKRFASDRKAAAFGFNKKHAWDIAEQFRLAGVNFAYVDSDTPEGDEKFPEEGTRQWYWREYDRGGLIGISSCAITEIGWDHSICKVLLLCSKTASFPRYRQRLGRGSRPHKGYDHFRIHDHTGNLYEFLDKGPYFESEVDWQLDGDPVRLSDEDKARRVMTCKTPVLVGEDGPTPGFRGEVRDGYMLPCLTPIAPGPSRCPYCGIPLQVAPREIEVEAGELKEITPEIRAKSEAQLKHESKMREVYLEFAIDAATKRKTDGTPYAPGFAAMRFRDRFGRWPLKAWKDEAAAKIQGLSREFLEQPQYELEGERA